MLQVLTDRRFAWGVAYIGAFILLGALSNVGLFRRVGISPWDPAAGLTMAMTYIGGPYFAPFALTAPLINQFIIEDLALATLPRVIAAIADVALEMLAGLWLRQAGRINTPYLSVESTVRLVGVAGVVGVGSAVIAVANLAIAGYLKPYELLPAAWRAIVGDVVGILCVFPLMLVLHQRSLLPHLRWENAFQLLALVCALIIIFAFPEATAYQLFYVLFLPVLWIALQDGVLGAIVAANLCQLGIIVGAHFRFGLTPGLTALQGLMISLVITALLVGAVVTERQSAARRLRDQHAALNRRLRLSSAGETAAAIAHQINQPLTAVSTLAQIARDAHQRGDGPSVGRLLDKLNDESDRAAAVLRSIRDLVKQGSLNREMVDLLPLANELVALHASDCASHGINLDVDVRPGLPPIRADRTQLQQALFNLVTNSIEAMQESGRSGRIRLSASVVAGRDVIIEVSDDGPGFASGLGDLATTPFLTTKANGSGLGLAIARTVAEAHGGSLVIEPRQEGACVRLRIPMIEERYGTGDIHH